jgi:hypothetical protein
MSKQCAAPPGSLGIPWIPFEPPWGSHNHLGALLGPLPLPFLQQPCNGGMGGVVGFFVSFTGSTIDLIWLKVDEAHHGFGSSATKV